MTWVSKNVVNIKFGHSEFDIACHKVFPLAVTHDFLGFLHDLVQLVFNVLKERLNYLGLINLLRLYAEAF